MDLLYQKDIFTKTSKYTLNEEICTTTQNKYNFKIKGGVKQSQNDNSNLGCLHT